MQMLITGNCLQTHSHLIKVGEFSDSHQVRFDDLALIAVLITVMILHHLSVKIILALIAADILTHSRVHVGARIDAAGVALIVLLSIITNTDMMLYIFVVTDLPVTECQSSDG